MRQDFGTTLRVLIKARGFSVRGLAKAIAEERGTTIETERRSLNHYLANEKMPSEESVKAIRKALGVELGDLPTPAPSRVSASRLVSRLEIRLDEGVELAPDPAELLRAIGDGVAAIQQSQSEIVGRLAQLEALTRRAVGEQ